MKKFLTGALVVLMAVLFSCKTEISGSNNDSDGIITGKVLYSNTDDHSGILVSIEKTDGLRSASISNAIDNAERSVYSVDSSRTILSNKVTASDGSYIFTNLESGTYSIYASSQNSLQKAVVTNVVVETGRTVTAGDLKLTATGSLSGSIIVDGSDSGNLGFVIYIAGTSYMAYTDDSGSFEISNVPAGKNYQIVVQYGTFTYSWTTDFEVSAGETKNAGSKTFTSEQIKNNTDGKDGADGSDGTSIVWLGAFDSSDEIENPQYLNAYFNKKDGCSYIYNGTSWELLARAGDDGKDGADGLSIIWLGSFASSDEIENPAVLNAYYNTTDGCSYIYTASGWTILAKSGTDGADGTSIVWLGLHYSAPKTAENLNVYYNFTDGCSYIYADNSWHLLVKGNQNTDSTDEELLPTWLGSFSSSNEITEPQILDSYYNTTDDCSYVYTSVGWAVLEDTQNVTRKCVVSNWLGVKESADVILNPNFLDSYLNSTDGYSYIYDGTNWNLIAEVGSQENIYGIGKAFDLNNSKYLLVKESFYVDTRTKQAHVNLLKEYFDAENLVEVYDCLKRNTDSGTVRVYYAFFDETKKYLFGANDRWGTDIISSGTNAEKITAFNKLSVNEVLEYYANCIKINNTKTLYGTDLSKKVYNEIKYSYSEDGKTVYYDSNLKSINLLKDYVLTGTSERARWTFSHDFTSKRYGYNLKNGNDLQFASFSVYENTNRFRLDIKGIGHMRDTPDSSVWYLAININSVDAESAYFYVNKRESDVTTLSKSYSVTYSELSSDSEASEFISISSDTTQINGQSVPAKVTFTAPFKSSNAQLQPFTAVSWKPRYDETSASIVYEPDYEEFINNYKDNFVSLYENRLTDEPDNINLTDSTVAEDSTIPIFEFAQDSDTLKIELEDMSTNFAITTDSNASGGKAGKLEDASSYAYCYTKLPAGTYSAVLCENAPDSSSDALYFVFGDNDADNSMYRRVYPTTTGTYTETTNCQFTITADSDMTVKVTLKKNGLIQYGESGMLVDYIKFTRN